MDSYLVPAGYGEAEYVEKRSRFIGQVWRVESEAEARERIEESRRRYHDCRHNCWCYAIREGNILRYTDGGEPQGTAGQPMLNVFLKEEVTNTVCVVTRYFGGILLGAGGLTRAYGGTAKLALDAAGISRMRLWAVLMVPCPYSLYERGRGPDGSPSVGGRARVPGRRHRALRRNGGDPGGGGEIPAWSAVRHTFFFFVNKKRIKKKAWGSPHAFFLLKIK